LEEFRVMSGIEEEMLRLPRKWQERMHRAAAVAKMSKIGHVFEVEIEQW
jgi:hypothetical protein